MTLLRRVLAELLGPPTWALESTAAIAAWARQREQITANLEFALGRGKRVFSDTPVGN